MAHTPKPIRKAAKKHENASMKFRMSSAGSVGSGIETKHQAKKNIKLNKEYYKKRAIRESNERRGK